MKTPSHFPLLDFSNLSRLPSSVSRLDSGSSRAHLQYGLPSTSLYRLVLSASITHCCCHPAQIVFTLWRPSSPNYQELPGPPEPDSQLEMSAPEPSSTGTVNPAEKSEVGGTSFLDLPFELREMIYDLCALKPWLSPSYELPLQSKPVVSGMNLLRCSKQIHNEISQRLDIWSSRWELWLRPSTLTPFGTEMNCSLAMSGLHDLALAKIRYLQIFIKITTDTPAVSGIHGLEVLLKLKSLRYLCIAIFLDHSCASIMTKESSHPKHIPFITGLVVHALSHIPTSVPGVIWCLVDPKNSQDLGKSLREIAEKYKSVRGSAYTSQQNTRV